MSDGATLLWLELTGKCQLECTHCYADSGPHGTDGTMTRQDWLRVITEAAAGGVRSVCFIGGEPTLHPHLGEFVAHAVAVGLDVEIFTNLVRVPEALWEIFTLPGVRISTSYYSDRAADHDAITARRGSHARTLTNIRTARERGVNLTGQVITVLPHQRVEQAHQQLATLDAQDRVHQVQHIGRAARESGATMADLCGQCAGPTLAVYPDGSVHPCAMARWITVGNVTETSLSAIFRSGDVRRARNEIQRAVGTPENDGPVNREYRCGSTSCSP